MSLYANFYTFKKEIDSTEQPTGTGTQYSITLKETTSITTPVIELHASAIGYNYCYIPTFGRYYFVQQTRILNNNRIEFALTVDVLATYKSDILASSLYVLRSASSYNDNLVDDTWVHSTTFDEDVLYNTDFPSYDATGCYIVTIVNNESGVTANPASAMYLMSESEVANMMEALFDAIGDYDFDDLTATYFNPAQYITSCKWVPFNLTSLATEQGNVRTTPLQVGWFSLPGIGAYRVTKYGKTLSFSLTVGSYSDWTDRAPEWTRYSLYVPGFGLTEIDPIYSGQTLSGKISVDFNTGQANLMLTTGTNQIAAQLSGTIGADVAINQVGGSIEFPTSLTQAVAMGGKIAGGTIARAGGPKVAETIASFMGLSTMWPGYLLEGGLEGLRQETQHLMNSGKEVAAAVKDAAIQTFFNPSVSTAGADGCRYTITDNHKIILYRRKYNHYNPAVSKLGGVCQQVKTLSTLSGYTVVANGLIEMAGTVEERNAVTSLLEGGFIIA